MMMMIIDDDDDEREYDRMSRMGRIVLDANMIMLEVGRRQMCNTLNRIENLIPYHTKSDHQTQLILQSNLTSFILNSLKFYI